MVAKHEHETTQPVHSLFAHSSRTLVAATLLLDFRLMQAQMSVTRNASTYSFGVDEGAPLPLEQEVDLYLDAPWGLEGALAEALRAELKDNPCVRDVNLQEGPVAAAPATVIVVEIAEPSVFFQKTSISVRSTAKEEDHSPVKGQL